MDWFPIKVTVSVPQITEGEKRFNLWIAHKVVSGQVKKGTFIINSIAQENEVRKPLVDFLGCVRLCKPGKNGRFRPLWPLLVVVAH